MAHVTLPARCSWRAQLATFVLAVVVFRNLRAMIEADDVAAALVGVQLAVALLNAAAIAG